MAALSDARRMPDETLVTTLAETEYLVNSRPLTYSGTEDTELDAITPNHFLLGSTSGHHLPFQVPISIAEEIRSSYKQMYFKTANYLLSFVERLMNSKADIFGLKFDKFYEL